MEPDVDYEENAVLAIGLNVGLGTQSIPDSRIDLVAPSLSDPNDAANGLGAATGSVLTDESNGALYAVVVPATDPAPSAAEVEVGQRNGGAAAPWAGSQVVCTTGEQLLSPAPSSLAAGKAYKTCFMHKDAAGNRSSVVVAAGFITDAAVSPASIFASRDGSVLRFGTADLTPFVERGVTDATAGSSIVATPGSLVGSFKDNVNGVWWDALDDSRRGTLLNPSGSIWCLANSGTNCDYRTRTTVISALSGTEFIAAAVEFTAYGGAAGQVPAFGLAAFAAGSDEFDVRVRCSASNARQAVGRVRLSSDSIGPFTTKASSADVSISMPLTLWSQLGSDLVTLGSSEGLNRSAAAALGGNTGLAQYARLFAGAGNLAPCRIYGFYALGTVPSVEEEAFILADLAALRGA